MVGPALAGLELGLDERDDRGRARGRASSATGPRTRSSEMNETSIDRERDRLGQRRRRSASRAFVRSIDDDPWIAPQRLGELAAPTSSA